MSDEPASATVSTDRIEERFMASLKIRPFPVTELQEMIIALHASGQTERLSDCLLVLQNEYEKEGELDALLRLLNLRAGWGGDEAALAAEFQEILAVAAHKDRVHAAMVDSVAFGSVPVAESLRRLQTLLGCRPGAFCLDKTWGFGIVRRLDGFYKRIVIDFDRRKAHALAFAYAAESLRVLDSSHILGALHTDAEAFYAKVKSAPDEIVLMALRSFGPMSVTHMEDEFARHGILPKGETWKTFWTNARAKLKGNSGIRIPPATKKNEPIQLPQRAAAQTLRLEIRRQFRSCRVVLTQCQLQRPVRVQHNRGSAAARDPVRLFVRRLLPLILRGLVRGLAAPLLRGAL